jgi:hypothetical protein
MKPLGLQVHLSFSWEKKFPPIFIRTGGRSKKDRVKVNAQYYRAKVLVPLIADAKKFYGKRQWTFQQDGAPSHSAEENQDWLVAQGVAFIELRNRKKNSKYGRTNLRWMAVSPDCAPNDYAINGILQERIGRVASKSLDELEGRIRAAWSRISMKTIRKTIMAFPKRLRKCIKANGERFE